MLRPASKQCTRKLSRLILILEEIPHVVLVEIRPFNPHEIWRDDEGGRQAGRQTFYALSTAHHAKIEINHQTSNIMRSFSKFD